MNTNKKPDERVLRYVKFETARLHDRPDEETATDLGLGSAAALYQQLKNDGYPVCPECGESPVGGEHCSSPRKRASAEGTGGTVELPPASRSVELFEEALEGFRADVTHLPNRREYLQNERFVVRRESVTGFEVPRGRTPLWNRYSRKDADPESWRIFCEERGVDPEVEYFDELMDAVIAPAGASPVPPEPLTRLVGAYALSERPIGPLIEALHPDPENIDMARVKQAIDEQRKKAGQLAALVRGSRIRTGPSVEGLDPLHHAVAVYVQRRKEEGASYERIVQDLQEGALGPQPNRITRSKVVHLANIPLG